jgi:hypothetical protein
MKAARTGFPLEKLKEISRALKVSFHYLAGSEEEEAERAREVREESRSLYFDDLSNDEIQLVVRFRAIISEDIRKEVFVSLQGNGHNGKWVVKYLHSKEINHPT